MRLSLYRLAILIPILFCFINASILGNNKVFKSEIQSLSTSQGCSNAGTEFYLTFHPCIEATDGNNYIKVFVWSETNAEVTLEVTGLSFKETKTLQPYTIEYFNLDPEVAQCYTKEIGKPVPKEAVYHDRAIHLYSDSPVFVYGLSQYEASSEGYLALPVTSLGKNYIVSSYADPSDNQTQHMPSYTSIIGVYDNTQVTFTLGGNPSSKTANGLRPGDELTETINKGDVLVIGSKGVGSDLSGSTISSKTPVAVISGNYCANIPVDADECDYTIEQELPMIAWGKKFHVTGIDSREYPSILKIFAKEAGTEVFRNGKSIGMINQPGGIEGDGYLSIILDDWENKPIVYEADKAISITQYNPSASFDGKESFPFQISLTPVELYQEKILFTAPAKPGESVFIDNFLNIVYRADNGGNIPDDIEIAESNGNTLTWKKLKDSYPGSGSKLDDEKNGRSYYAKTIKLNNDNTYGLRAGDPIAVYSYGFSTNSGYGFPAGLSTSDLEADDNEAPVPNWTFTCGEVDGGTITDMPDIDSLRSNLGLMYMIKDQSFNYDFWYFPFKAGEDKTTYWKATLLDKSQDARAVIYFSDRSGNDTTIVLEYYATKLAITPNYHNFGLLDVGVPVEQEFFVHNLSNRGPVDLSRLELKGSGNDFELVPSSYSLNHVIMPGDSMSFLLRFSSNSNGRFIDSIGTGDSCVFKFFSRVEAKIGQALIDVSDHNYYDVRVNTTVNHEFTIANNGSYDLVITGYNGPSDPVVYQHDLPVVSDSDPITIKPGEEFKFNVSFTPQAEIPYPDQITFTSNADGTDSIAELNGNGILTPLGANSYNWNGRRIDRGAFPSGPYPPDAAVNVILLTNYITDDINITDIQITDVYGNGSAFEFNRNILTNGLTIPGKSDTLIPVLFHPTVPGPHKIIIKYINDANSDTETILEGIGILPKVYAEDQDFGSTVINDLGGYQEKKVRFENTQWFVQDTVDVSDSLIIDELIIGPTGTEISSDAAAWTDPTQRGSEGFYFDITSIEHSVHGTVSLPIILSPGEYVDINVRFIASHNGVHSAWLQTDCDADSNAVSNWTGQGEAQGIYVNGDAGESCIFEEDTLFIEIGNNDAGIIDVHELKMDPQIFEFEFVDPSIVNGFQLVENDPKFVGIRYRPQNEGTHSTQLIIRNSSVEDSVIVLDINGEGVHYDRVSTSSLSQAKVDLHNPLYYRIDLEESPDKDISLANITDFEVKISFRKDFIVPRMNEIVQGPATDGKFNMAVNRGFADAEETIMELTFSFTAIGNNYLQDGGRLVEITFDPFLPWFATDETDKEERLDSVVIYSEFIIAGSQCLDISGDSKGLKMQIICTNELRQIVYSGENYALKQISPNPVGTSGADISFSVGIQGWTEISIVSSAGIVVSRLVAATLKPGNYEVSIPIDELVTGMYLINMRSGPFHQQRKLVISK